MTKRRPLLAGDSMLGLLLGARVFQGSSAGAGTAETFAVTKTDAEWRRFLSPAQYAILRRQGTELPGSSPLDHETRHGRYDSPAARTRSSPRMPSSTAAPAGPVSGSRSTMPWTRRRTTASLCNGPRCIAAFAGATSATSSRTGRARPACATA
jgi:hypothetical protein